MSDNEFTGDQPENKSVAGRTAWWLLLAAAALVPLAIGFVPFLGRTGIFLSHTSITAQSTALGLLLGGSLLCWAVGIAKSELAFRRPPYSSLVVVLVGLMLVSTLFAMDTTVAIFGHEYAEQGIIAQIGCIAALFLVTQLVSSRQRFLLILQVIVAASTLVALLGCLESFGLPFFPTDREAWLAERGTSTMGNPDMLGAYLVLPLLLSLALGIKGPGRLRWVWPISSVILSLSLIFTQTRGAWLGALVALFVFGVAVFRSREKGQANKALAVSGVLLFLSALSVAAYKSFLGFQPLLWRVSESFTGLGDATGGRALIWLETLRIIAKRPLIGVGADNYLYAWYGTTSTAPISTLGIMGTINEAHSYWLGLAVSFGVPAAVVVLTLTCLLLWRSRSAVANTAVFSSQYRTLYAALWSGFVGLCVALTFSVVLTPLALLFWMALGLLMIPQMGQEEGSHQGAWLTHSTTIAAGFLGLCLIFWGGLTGISSAVEYTDVGTETAAALQATRTASRIAPWRQYPRFRETQLFEQSGASVDQLAQSYEALIVAAPFEYRYYEALVKVLRDQPQRATPVIERGLAVRPASLRLMSERARARALLGDLDSAERLAARAWDIARGIEDVKQAPDVGIVYVQVLAANENYIEAKRVLDELKARFPNNSTLGDLSEMLTRDAQ